MAINNVSAKIYNNKCVQPSFQGNMAGLGKKVLSSPGLKKMSDLFEYKAFNMSLVSMMVLLYGFTIFPRYLQAKDKHDRREIVIRDLLSVGAILFLATGLSAVMSRVFTKVSGFALNDIPSNYKKENPIVKIWSHINPKGGIELYSSQEIVTKYSNLENYPNGILDFFKFIRTHHGDIKKVLAYKHGGIKEYADAIVGKDVTTATSKEIEAAFARAEAKGSKELKSIYKVFSNPDNAFVRNAKTKNSLFSFLSVCLLTPGFMIWIEKFNEKLTKKQIAKEKALKAKQVETPQPLEAK